MLDLEEWAVRVLFIIALILVGGVIAVFMIGLK